MSPERQDYYAYWNDEELEKAKRVFWLGRDNDGQALLDYLRKTSNLERCLLAGLDFAAGIGGQTRRLLEVAAGVAWASALACARLDLHSVLAIDYSRHRLARAPKAWQALGLSPTALRTREADFLALAPEPEPFDAILFCQGAYMFEDLGRLFAASARWLRPGGWLLVACETADGLGADDPGQPDASGRFIYGTRHYVRALEQASFQARVQELDYPDMPRQDGQGNARNIVGLWPGEGI